MTVYALTEDLSPLQFYVKPRLGALYNIAKAAKLKAMLESSIQRRFPRGLKVHVHSVDRFGCLAQLTRVLKNSDLCITRAKVSPSPPLLQNVNTGPVHELNIIGEPSVIFAASQHAKTKSNTVCIAAYRSLSSTVRLSWLAACPLYS